MIFGRRKNIDMEIIATLDMRIHLICVHHDQMLEACFKLATVPVAMKTSGVISQTAAEFFLEVVKCLPIAHDDARQTDIGRCQR